MNVIGGGYKVQTMEGKIETKNRGESQMIQI